MTAIVKIVDPILDQIEEHLGGYDATIIRCQLDRNSIKEDFDILFLLIDEVFECIHKFALLLADEYVHRLGDGLDFFSSSILDVPEADALTLIILNRLLIVSGCAIDSGTSDASRPGRAVLGHFSDAAMATSPRVDIDTLDVLPERVWV